MSDTQHLSTMTTDVLKHFRPWSGVVPAGYFAYFLGNLTRADYWAFPSEIRQHYDRERFESFSAPSVDDNIFDWLILLEAVVEARGSFTMAALGAGWGRWLVAGALAVKQYSGIPVHLIGVEAEPTHFRWMEEHFRDNGIDPSEHELIEAAAGRRSGRGWFYVGKPDAWYGQSLIADTALAAIDAGVETSYNGERARRVLTIDLPTLVARYPRIDYLHMDIQGAELDFLSSDPPSLDAKVKRVLIGTHSTAIEEGLRALFRGLGWRCEHDIPLNGQVRVDDRVVTVGDGVQVWTNPSL